MEFKKLSAIVIMMVILFSFSFIVEQGINGSGVNDRNGNQIEMAGPSLISNSQTVVILVHGFEPGDTSGAQCAGTWHSGVNIYQELVNAGYLVGSVQYYGEFEIQFSNGYIFTDSSFFGTSNTPIYSIGNELGTALQEIFAGSNYNVDMIGYSMGGLVTAYALEHYHLTNINLKNVIFMASPFDGSPLAGVAQCLGLSGYAGTEVNEMVQGSNFLNGLAVSIGSMYTNYGSTVWTVYAGTYDPWWGYVFFSGANDGVVSEHSATYFGYDHLYTFSGDLHTASLDDFTWSGISYFQDQSVANTILENFAGNY
ncbi:esterase/lipase family protein [Cuniculiplasma sp. SKW4]|uniref:esterase/lipase family protein n=1 Tax=Cuniculiplasma sp. SKW4 TaxID=3400171 RepID=UPI003FD32D33